jgi:hypothetical protein
LQKYLHTGSLGSTLGLATSLSSLLKSLLDAAGSLLGLSNRVGTGSLHSTLSSFGDSSRSRFSSFGSLLSKTDSLLGLSLSGFLLGASTAMMTSTMSLYIYNLKKIKFSNSKQYW